jgi:hypothetical protein
MVRASRIVPATLVALFLALLVYAFTQPRPGSSTNPLDRARYLASANETIRATDDDPESVRFRNEFVPKVKDALPPVCGEINRKNRSGGYIGYQRFVWSIYGRLLEGDVSAEAFERTWLTLCVDRK